MTSGIIKLLPDALINQIAAGEVVQRPASVLKELMENALDAGATHVQVFIKDSGKTLIQVVDNGKGMNPLDARMCFERHATSKIQQVADLFCIRTMGFRGEALASIASVAQVTLTTSTEQAEIGTLIQMDGSVFQKQEAVICPKGTSISVKNLFFNVPARRKFLKSDPVELRHLIREFLQIALSYPNIQFNFQHNQQEIFKLAATTLENRICDAFDGIEKKDLISIQEKSSQLEIAGFIGSPALAKNSRGEQYFFVNQRFIKSQYLNHAVSKAFEQLIPKGSFPFFVIFLAIEPSKIDINIHPTKTEIQFEDEAMIYAMVLGAVRKAAGQFNMQLGTQENTENADFQQIFNVFANQNQPTEEDLTIKQYKEKNQFYPNKNEFTTKVEVPNWRELYQTMPMNEVVQKIISSDASFSNKSFVQLHQRYIVAEHESGLLLIDQRAAHERILYEKLQKKKSGKKNSQQLLYPLVLDLNIQDKLLLEAQFELLQELGFMLHVSENKVFIHGIPSEIRSQIVEAMLKDLIHELRENPAFQIDIEDQLFQLLARQAAIPSPKVLSQSEMENIVTQLFVCDSPSFTPKGKPTFLLIDLEEISNRLRS